MVDAPQRGTERAFSEEFHYLISISNMISNHDFIVTFVIIIPIVVIILLLLTLFGIFNLAAALARLWIRAVVVLLLRLRLIV